MLHTHVSLGTAIDPAILKSAEEGREKNIYVEINSSLQTKMGYIPNSIFFFSPI